MAPNLLVDDYKKFELIKASCNETVRIHVVEWFLIQVRSDRETLYNSYKPWVGVGIALACVICILLMVADLVHGFRHKKLWFPCKYFTIDAVSLTLIPIILNLAMDQSSLFQDEVDWNTKMASMVFLVTMMANSLPSLATMTNRGLITNMIALVIFITSLLYNICIQIYTGSLFYDEDAYEYPNLDIPFLSRLAIVLFSVVPTLLLLLIFVCSSLAIPTSKEILELKYQVAYQTYLKDQELQAGSLLSVEKLEQHMTNYWIMAQTGNPQFMLACFATTRAAGVICSTYSGLYIFYMITSLEFIGKNESDYKWSMLVISIIYFIGIVIGTIAPLARCFANLNYKFSVKWIWKQVKVFRVESYWTGILCDWKDTGVPFASSSRKCKMFIQYMKILILNICEGMQITGVVVSQMVASITLLIALITLMFVTCVWKQLKPLFNNPGILLRKKLEKVLIYKDIRKYVLLVEDDIELAEGTLKRILKSRNHLIQKASKRQPKKLMKLLAKSRGFEGVEKFDNHHIQPLSSEEYVNCWSLALVTLTSIAISLPGIQNKIVNDLLSAMTEGLKYVKIVEKCFNGTKNHVSVQKAAKTLWKEVNILHKWLGYNLPKPKGNTARDILWWLKHTSQNMVIKVEGVDIGGEISNISKYRSICANSMYRITETILVSHHENIDELGNEELFSYLSSIIADILAACLINIPQVILMKSNETAIEKREASVKAGMQLLGKTTRIINNLKIRELPMLDPNELAFIDHWRAHLRNSSP